MLTFAFNFWILNFYPIQTEQTKLNWVLTKQKLNLIFVHLSVSGYTTTWADFTKICYGPLPWPGKCKCAWTCIKPNGCSLPICNYHNQAQVLTFLLILFCFLLFIKDPWSKPTFRLFKLIQSHQNAFSSKIYSPTQQVCPTKLTLGITHCLYKPSLSVTPPSRVDVVLFQGCVSIEPNPSPPN